MLKFGDKNEFAIWYLAADEVFPDYATNDDLPDDLPVSGRVYMWMKGENIFEYTENTRFETYQDRLVRLVKFLLYNLYIHMFANDFPFNEIEGKNGSQLFEHYRAIISPLAELKGDDIVVYELTQEEEAKNDRLNSWVRSHALRNSLPGTLVPNAMFRMKNNMVEVSWNTSFKEEFYGEYIGYKHVQGCALIDRKLYRDVVLQFAYAFIKNISKLTPPYCEELKSDILEITRETELH